jgi:hypothetical protein
MPRHQYVYRAQTPAAFTLVELLVSSTIALVVMGAVASLFGIFSRASTNSQAIVDLSSRMRSTANRLRQDLTGLTAPLTPPLRPESDAGYFELIEGPIQDGLATSVSGTLIMQSGTAVWASGTTSLLADTDDVLLFTTRSPAGPFEGNYNGAQIESSTAEVAWFCRPSAIQPVAGVQLQTLYRRQLLVVGYVGAAPFYVAGSSTNNQVIGTLPAIYGTYDISLRSDPTVAGALVPNTLGDLTTRENRFFHGPTWSAAFPNSWVNVTFDGTTREGEDVVLTNVIAFDVRVFDPDAVARLNGSTVVYPNDQTYSNALPSAGFTGCFLDLGCSNAVAMTVLSGTGNPKSRLHKTSLTGTATYDTWSTGYETNGIDDNVPLNGVIDDATNGGDDSVPPNGVIDDADETETAPPYSRPLRAIEIRIRCYDPTSREIRQTTVRHTFTN